MTDFTLRAENDRWELIRYLEALSPDKVWTVTVKQKKQRRSLSANALYWKWMETAGNELGYDKDEIDYWCKEAFDCPYKEITVDGQTIRRRSTSGLDKLEMSAYMDRVYRRLVGDMGIYLPIPEEQFAA